MDFISDVEKKMGDMLGGSAMLCQKGDETPHEVLYFPITALGEPIRLALAVGGFPFTDTNPRNCETFQERKKELSPLGEAGQVPILVLPNGKTMCQCRAILRYLGKVCKFEGTPLYPTDPIAAYEADALIELCEDMRSPLGATFAISDQAEKEAARAAVWNSNLQPDFNVRVCDSFDIIIFTVLRELDESNRFVQKSAESTSI